MALSAQDKILYVANKLGLATLKDMQGSTGAVYDVDINNSGVIFGNASQHANPGITNINQNKFEVNEALLVETIGFDVIVATEGNYTTASIYDLYGPNCVVVFDLIIGNKVVMKDTPVWCAGSPLTFASANIGVREIGTGLVNSVRPRHQIYLEGAGILIPPQVEYSVNYKVVNLDTQAVLPTTNLRAYLFGTSVLLNFNTSL